MKIIKIMLIAVVSFGVSYGMVSLILKPNKPNLPSVENMELAINLISEVSSDEYEVYIAVLKEKSQKKKFVVSDKTIQKDSIGEAFSGENESVQKSEAIKSFQQRNVISHKLETKFPTDIDYKIIKQKEINEYFKNEKTWDAFYKDFPESDGLYDFSRVGFSRDRKEALIYVSHSCGGKCGTGRYYYLTKESGTWEIVEEVYLWTA